MEALQQKVRSLEEAKINSGNELATNDREKRRLEQEAAELRRKIKEFDDQLSEVMTSEDGDLEDELDQTKLRLEKARLDLQVKEANKFTYAAYIKEIDDMVDSGNKSCCPTCNRAFKSEGEARELKADLEDIIAKIPSKVNNLRNKVKAEERRLEELQVLLPTKRQVDEHRTSAQTKDRRIAEIARAKKARGVLVVIMLLACQRNLMTLIKLTSDNVQET